jgi:GTP-binding protein
MMFKSTEFFKSAFSMQDIPKENRPEAVLCGRSNVGKSTFLNTICGKKKLAKVSSIPGKTRSLNYYLIDEKIYLVDLPGFGYAKASKEEQMRWQKLIPEYFARAQQIKFAFHLIDARHQPMKLDAQLAEMMAHYAIAVKVILTKSDKIKNTERATAVRAACALYPYLKLGTDLFFFSAITGEGKKEIQTIIRRMF